MLCCGAARRRRCARGAAILLTHVNLLLMLFSGAALATVARLKWDPSAYIPLREALPVEYRAACALLLAFALALLALAHLALAALASSSASARRRPMLFTYAAVMSLLTLVEVGAVGWVVFRVLAFLESPAAERLLELAELHDHLRAALQILARWYPLPEKINDLINEAIEDGPRNGYVAEGAAIVLLVLQPSAVALALVAAAPPARRAAPRLSLSTLATTASATSAGSYARRAQRARYSYHSVADKGGEDDKGSRGGAVQKAPLRTAYRNGRLVIL